MMYKQRKGNVYMIVAPWELVENVPVKTSQNGSDQYRDIHIVSVETPTYTVTCKSRHRVREHSQQPLCTQLGEQDNTASLVTPR